MRKIKYYSAYKTGDSVCLCAPKNSLGIQYFRDKVGNNITYTPKSMLPNFKGKFVKGLKSGGNVILYVWKEYLNTVFRRSIDPTGIITYEPMEVIKNDTR